MAFDPGASFDAYGTSCKMKRALKLASWAALAAAFAIASGASWYALSPPGSENLPVTGPLLSLSSPEGQQLLAASSHAVDHGQLEPFLVAQERRAFCGPATSAAVVNAALQPPRPVTQFSLFDATGSPLKSELAVSFSGLTLEELAQLLRANGLRVQTVHAGESDVASFRHAAQAALSEALTYLVVNYDRKVLGQSGAGHISPIGAYSPAGDRLLVMDVATYKYPYTWVPLAELWSAMSTVDSDSGQTRGYLLVSASAPAGDTSGR